MAFNLDRFVDACVAAAGGADPVERVRQLLQAALAETDLGAALPASQEDETLLHASAKLTVYGLRLTPRIHYPPHDHRMVAVIGLYEGVETNSFYRREGSGLVKTALHDSRAPEVFVLPADTIHSVANPGRRHSRAIHVYLGPLTRIERSVWSSDGLQERPFDNAFYFSQARVMGD
ncbi:MAG TPA: autotransporter [Albitalea sp.]|uniref:autotransporter n=1 Tax=Piscinibacter sp. TaxID=1903157 RepID=UPI002ED3EEAD